MRNLIRQYILPLLTGALLLFLLVYWAVNEKKNTLRTAEKELIHASKTLVGTLKGSIQSEISRCQIDEERLQTVLEHVIVTAELKYIQIDIEDKKIISIPPESTLTFHDKEGHSLQKDIFYYWQTVKMQDTSAIKKYGSGCGKGQGQGKGGGSGKGRGKGKTEKKIIEEIPIEPGIDLTDSTQKIIIGLPLVSYKQRLAEADERLLLSLISAGIAAIVLIAAWMFNIKSRNLKEELFKIKDKAERLEELNLVAAGLAHETKNPLGIIRALAQRIADGKHDSDHKDMAQKIVDEADVTTERLSDFMNYAKITPPQKTNLNARELLLHISELVKPDFEDKGVKLVTEIENINISADAEMLSQMTINLLLNSLNASKKEDKTLLSLKKADINHAVLTVEDTGCGITREMLPTVFKPYVSGRPGGHGIGLSVVKRIVEESGWKINMESEENKGTKVFVSNIKFAT
jgi:signal transduction histidine kinase